MGGGEPHAITSMPKSVESIAWSPNGKQIAFGAATRPSDFDKKKDGDEPKESDVRVINQAVYRFNGAGYDDPTRLTHIWVVDAADDAKPKQLTTGDFDEESATWSADGARIYFISTRVKEPYYDPRDSDLYFVPASGGDIVKLADSKGSISRIAPSPDGKWIAFIGNTAEPIHSYDQSDLWVVTTSGGEPRNLTANFDNDVMTGIGGDQHAPRGGRSALERVKKIQRLNAEFAEHAENPWHLLCALRGLCVDTRIHLAFRFTPGFMLSPRFRGLYEPRC